MKINKSFVDIWSSYAIYYFGKVNLGIVVPVLLATYNDLNMYNVGLVSSGFFFAYAAGQFLHGQISERFNPFIYVSIGLIGSAIMNMLLGFFGSFFFILFMGEVMDGLFQSMGWSSIVRANAIMQESDKRESSSTILGTSYQIGNSVAWLISSFAVGQWGWRWGFFIASVFLVARGLLLLITKPKIEIKPAQKVKVQVKTTLSFPIMTSGLSLCFLNMVRFGVITWIPLYLFESENLTAQQMGSVGLKIFLIPVAGVLGTLIYNRLKMNRDVITIIFLIMLGISFAVFPFTSGLLSTIVLIIGGFFLYGPHVFLVSTMPTRFVDKQVVAASTGFIDGMGYVGTVLIGIIVPVLVKNTTDGWQNVFIFWTILSIVVAGLVGLVYKRFKVEQTVTEPVT